MIPNKIVRIRGDWYDEFLATYLLPQYDKIREILREKRHAISITDLTYRVINHWSEMGLLSDDTQSGTGWRKFSLVDLLWIRMLNDLREFGMPLEALKTTRAWLFHRGKPESHVNFELFLLLALKSKGVIVVVAPDGEADIMLEEEYYGQYQFLPLPTSHIVININDILADLLQKPELKYKEELTLTLDEKESSLINTIRFEDNLTDVNLKVNNKQIGKVNFTTKVENPEHLVSLLAQIQKQNVDRDVVLKQKDGKFVLLEIVDKK